MVSVNTNFEKQKKNCPQINTDKIENNNLKQSSIGFIYFSKTPKKSVCICVHLWINKIGVTEYLKEKVYSSK